ncbi:MAG: hypothetical protein WCT77_03065 [Bacteroidota bacterium]
MEEYGSNNNNYNIDKNLKNSLTERLIRYNARQCSICGSPPWWKFWEWEIFHNRDGRGVGE